jgi:thioesterase domain-containing protein
LKDSPLSHESVTEMANYYLGLLRQFQPRGPYYLGGWCYGGMVALEMARSLLKEGEQIGLLALIETGALPPRITNWRYYRHRCACLLSMGPRRWLTYIIHKCRYSRNAKLANRMRFRQSEQLLNADLKQVDPRLARLEHVYNTNLNALNSYQSIYYPGTVTLFNAAEKDLAVIPDPYYGWIGLARNIVIHEVPGNHDTMLAEPNVRDLADKLDACLRRAQLVQKQA